MRETYVSLIARCFGKAKVSGCSFPKPLEVVANQETEDQIKDVQKLIKKVLGKDALGIYLYGSYTLGGLQKYSDIDLLAISKRPTSKEEKEVLVKNMLLISIDDPTQARRSVELTIIVHSEINPWIYPPKLDFQFGDWMRQDFEKGKIEPRDSNVEEDLAISITQVLLTGKTLKGPSPEQLLPPIPYKDFMTATAGEIGDLMAEFEPDTRNVLLTFARIWATLATDSISSKADAAAWAIAKLPQQFKPVIEHARAVSMDEIDENWADLRETLKPCADYMIKEIQKLRLELDINDAKKRIKVLSS